MSTDLPEPDAADAVFSDEDGVLYDDEVTPEYGILGFTLRELLIVGVWLLSFIVSFFPLSGGVSLWGIGIQWILPIGVPTVAVFLLVLRRFSPDGIRRVGSLGIDQFASVAFAVSACVWAGNLWLAVSAVISTGHWGLPWNALLQVVTSVALVVLTVFAPLIPGLKEDFQGRLVTLAHRNANPVRPVIPRPRPEGATQGVADDSRTEAESEGHRTDVIPGALDPELAADRERAVDHSARHEDVTLERDVDRDAYTEDYSGRVPLTAHASGGGTGTVPVASDEEYTPAYSRRSRAEQPEIVSDTGSIESLLGTRAQPVTGPVELQDEEALGDVRSQQDDATAFSGAPPAEAGDATVAPDDATAVRGDASAASDGAIATPDDATAVHAVVAEQDIEATNPREAAAAQPFWILAPTERDVHDERGAPLFRIGPSAWALVIEDRGGAFVVRHDDGRIGYLHDISDITKG